MTRYLLVSMLLASLHILKCNSLDSTSQNISNTSDLIMFETAHKIPILKGEQLFQTAHSIMTNSLNEMSDSDMTAMNNIKNAMTLLPTKERPELNPVLSALINEDVMKSIESKRAIEQKQLDEIQYEKAKVLDTQINLVTETPPIVLTTMSYPKRIEDINEEFVDQSVNLDTAGSENTKKSRIVIKKGPNGQDYEYEYIYYYEDDDDYQKQKETNNDMNERPVVEPNDEPVLSSTLLDNNIKNDMEQEERLPTNTRFPSRSKTPNVQPTAFNDPIENMTERKKISVKRPSLELVDSESFNTDEKQLKGARNADTDSKPNIINKNKNDQTNDKSEDTLTNNLLEMNKDEDILNRTEENIILQTSSTPLMEKAALDLYAILTNENFNIDSTTSTNEDATTEITTLSSTDEENTTNLIVESSSSSPSDQSTQVSSTPEPITTTTTTTEKFSIVDVNNINRKTVPSLRTRYRSKQTSPSQSTSTTTESSVSGDQSKGSKSRFVRPSYGIRNRNSIKPTTAAQNVDEDEVTAKEVKPVNVGFNKNRPRNRFNLRGTSTTERTSESVLGDDADTSITTSTTRPIRNRPKISLRSRSKPTTTSANATKVENDVESKTDENLKNTDPVKTSPIRPSRFNINRTNTNRRFQHTKINQGGDTPIATETNNDGHETADEKMSINEKVENDTHANDRTKTASRVNGSQRVSPSNARRINPLLSKRRLNLGQSTTESSTIETSPNVQNESTEVEKQIEDTTEMTETTTKQPRGLGLLGKRRRLPLRRPGTIL